MTYVFECDSIPLCPFGFDSIRIDSFVWVCNDDWYICSITPKMWCLFFFLCINHIMCTSIFIRRSPAFANGHPKREYPQTMNAHTTKRNWINKQLHIKYVHDQLDCSALHSIVAYTLDYVFHCRERTHTLAYTHKHCDVHCVCIHSILFCILSIYFHSIITFDQLKYTETRRLSARAHTHNNSRQRDLYLYH